MQCRTSERERRRVISAWCLAHDRSSALGVDSAFPLALPPARAFSRGSSCGDQGGASKPQTPHTAHSSRSPLVRSTSARPRLWAESSRARPISRKVTVTRIASPGGVAAVDSGAHLPSDLVSGSGYLELGFWRPTKRAQHPFVGVMSIAACLIGLSGCRKLLACSVLPRIHCPCFRFFGSHRHVTHIAPRPHASDACLGRAAPHSTLDSHSDW